MSHHEEDGMPVSIKIGMTVCCLFCGKKFYISLEKRPKHCPGCQRILGNHYEIISEEYKERG